MTMTALDDTIPMEAAHAATSGTSGTQLCDQCDPPKAVRNLVQHRYKVHGRGRAADRQPRPPGAPASRRPKSIRADMEVSLAFICQVVALKDPVCGAVAMGQVPQIALAWDNWAKSSPAVHRYLTWALSGGGALGVALAHIPIVLIVVQHHGPDRYQYFPPPDPAAAMNGAGGHDDEPVAPAWSAGDPVASGYVPAGADRAR